MFGQLVGLFLSNGEVTLKPVMPSKVRPPEPGIIPLQWRGHVEAREIKSTTYAVLGLFLSNGEVTLKQIAFANTFQPMERIIPLQWRGHVEASTRTFCRS